MIMAVGHDFVRPGQVDPSTPPPDNCVACGEPERDHLPEEASSVLLFVVQAYQFAGVPDPERLARLFLMTGPALLGLIECPACAQSEDAGQDFRGHSPDELARYHSNQ